MLHTTSHVTCTKWRNRGVGKRLRDGFHEHLRDVKNNDKDASKHVSKHFANHSFNNLTVCGLSFNQGNTEGHKNSEQ